MPNKQHTIDELLLKNGITHLTGKEHDGIIVAFNQYHQQQKLSQEDKQHLQWMYNRLAHVHLENENYDYMSRMKQILNKL
jgi:uncharacterized protein (UPF0332 family)